MAMNGPEITALLKIVRGSDTPDISLSDIDIQQLIRFSYRHKVVYQMLLFAQKHPEVFSGGQVTKLSNRNREVAQRSLTQLNEMKKIAGILSEKKIPFVCIKGPQLSRMLYGREAIKESVDLDIMLVDSNHLRKVHEIFTRLGYTESNLNDFPDSWHRKIFLIAKREVHYFNKENRCAIDLHIRPGANTYLTAKNFSGFLGGLTTYDLEGTPINVLPDEAYFVYLCYHGALHQFMRLAWLLDIRAFLQQKSKTLDFNKVIKIARILNVERSVYLALLLLEHYFGDDFNAGPQFIIRSKRIQKLAVRCHAMLCSEPGYALSIKGRIGKVIYIMMLIKGFRGKIDWFYGIFMRQVMGMVTAGGGHPT